MSEEPDPDAWGTESDPDAWGTESDPDEEPTDDARIEEFLERLEDTDLGDGESGRSPADEPELGGSDELRGDASDAGDISPDASDIGQGPSETADPALERSDTETGETRGRLWDSFDSEEGDSPDAEQPSSGARTEETTAPSTTSVPSSHSRGGTEPDGPTDPEPATTGGDSDPEAPDESSGSSFRTILKRISNRIDPTSSGSAADDTTAQPSNESADAGGPTAGTTGSAGPDHPSPESATGPAATGAAGGSPPGGGYTGGGGAQDTIDEILNTIDRFCRATSSSQVLVLSPTAHSITNEIYRRALLPADGSGQDVLFVSATQTVGDQLAATERIPDWTEGKTGVIEVGQGGLKPAGPDAGPDVTHKLDIYKRMSKLQHLAKLGVNISHIVSQWNASHRPTVVGVHTLSAVQQYVGTETMFQFLFTLEGQLNSLGVMGFYHMDPSVHTDNEISTITQAFDLIIRVSSDGTVDIE